VNGDGATGRLLLLALGSGACALVYQIAWTRELRLVFGASTLASAAVVAIFVGGLGVGARLIGETAERSATPLRLYALLELGVAAASAWTPILLALVQRIYVATGGSVVLGAHGATAVRAVLAAVVLSVPTVLMGGTLPALAKASMARCAPGADPARERVAGLYAVNTIGAVVGCLVATFVALERLGTHRTLWAAAFVNAIVGLLAWSMAKREPAVDAPLEEDDGPVFQRYTAPWFVCFVATVSGFAFFLMELVFTRLLTPLLGGTVYTFGIVLAVALLGIGMGSAFYARLPWFVGPGRGTLAATSILEALFLLTPYILGDRIAILAIWARPAQGATFYSYVPGWLLVTAVVGLPASLLAGVQFPVLIALLGRGGANVARQVGRAYAWNTVGAVAGAVAGGFGLMPALGATGCWKLAAALLGACAVGSIVQDGWRKGERTSALAILGWIFVGVMAVRHAKGPTAAWRHSPIGAGRVARDVVKDGESIFSYAQERRRGLVWEADGIESSIGIYGGNGYAFLTNGKSDGHCRIDAGTQVMGGVLPALLHPAPRSAMVIGLGSGSSAGWLGRVPGMERVDVVELEPAMKEIARRCAFANEHVLDDPRVHLTLGDAREVLSVTPARYDIVFSEPSNPYRAGVASLYTREYYERVRDHLRPGGIFTQWVQAYSIDRGTMRTIFATLASVFPHVEAWQLEEPDLALVASNEPIAKDAASLRARIRGAPFAKALLATWSVDDLEGLLAHFVAGPALAARIANDPGVARNTDDRTVVEFGFARAVVEADHADLVDIEDVRAWARDDGASRPEMTGDVDWRRVGLERAELPTAVGRYTPGSNPDDADADVRARLAFLRAGNAAYEAQSSVDALAEWDAAPHTDGPLTAVEARLLAETAVRANDPRAVTWTEAVERRSALEGAAMRARFHLYDEKDLAADPDQLHAQEDLVLQVLRGRRDDPWAATDLVSSVVLGSSRLARVDPPRAPELLEAVMRPFADGLEEDIRIGSAMTIVKELPDWQGCEAVVAQAERSRPIEAYVGFRAACYRERRDRRAGWADAVNQEVRARIEAEVKAEKGSGWVWAL
jgi:predicted membrane-bound spermidine synthase